jgi:hypothetical protein
LKPILALVRNVGTNSNILVLRRDHSTTLELKEVILSKHLALKLGLGYGEIDGNGEPIAYKIGAKYYLKR